MYTLGKGVQKDHMEAVKWFRKAARKGYEPLKQQIQEAGENLKNQLL
jgi:TPR repeat protein